MQICFFRLRLGSGGGSSGGRADGWIGKSDGSLKGQRAEEIEVLNMQIELKNWGGRREVDRKEETARKG